MARASIIVPVLNEAGVVPDLLPRLRQLFPDAQLVVVDGGSSDATAALAAPHCDTLVISEAGRARQMNRGAEVADGDYYLFLHADCLPEFDDGQLAQALAARPLWGFCPVRLTGAEMAFTVISRFMNWRSRFTRVATGDQMQFVRADIFEQTGGFDDIPLMEDVAFSKRLRKLGPPMILDQSVLVSSRRWRERGVIRTTLTMWALRLAYVMGASPARLWRVYYGG